MSVHTGSAKNQMINAAAVGCEFQSFFMEKEDLFILKGMKGLPSVFHRSIFAEHCEMKYLLRRHDAEKFLIAQKKKVEEIGRKLNEKWGSGVVTVSIRDSYANMRPSSKIMELVDEARHAFEACG